MADEWKPVQGDVFQFDSEGSSIQGTLQKVRDGQYFRTNGEKSKVYDIMTSDGVKTIFGTAILERQMASVNEGDKVKVVYKGEVDTKSGRKAKDFDVFTK